jgi:hypothetical protein
MLFTTRRPPSAAASRWLYPKFFLFVAGAATGLLGIALHIDWLVNVAIGLLAIGFILKLVASRQADRDDVE